MNRIALGLGLLGVVACGGEDGVTINPTPDGGGNDTGIVDSGSNPDTSITPDAATSDGSTADAGTSDGATTDAGSTDGGSGDGGTFQLGNVPGLVLWLDANKGITQVANKVSAWADQTSFKNDAAQTLAPRQPTAVAAVINGKPVVHFDKGGGNQGNVGNMMLIKDAVSLQWGTGDFFLATVARFDNAVNEASTGRGTGMFYTKISASSVSFPGPSLQGNIPGNGAASVGLTGSTNFTLNNFLTTPTAYNNNNPHLFAFQRSGVKLDLRVDGTSVASSTSNGINIDNVGTIARIGADGDATASRLDGDIAEMIAVKGALSGSDLASIESFLKTKYGL